MNDVSRRKSAAREILRTSRNKVYLDLRFLETSLFRLMPEENHQIFWGSDGERLWYEEEYLLRRYLQSPGNVGCDHLHTVLHCMYQHPFQNVQHEEHCWNLAADIAVTDVMEEMGIKWITEQIPEECFQVMDRIREGVRLMSAPHIAKYLQEAFSRNGSFCGYDFRKLETLFRRDSHDCWLGRNSSEAAASEESGNGGGAIEETDSGESGSGGGAIEETDSGESGSGGELVEETAPEESENSGESSQKSGTEEESPAGSARMNPTRMKKLSEEWKEAAEAAVLHAQGFSKGQGTMPQGMLLNLQKLTRETYDYGEFLRKFAVLNERMKINLDEFDYTYYLYGLRILKKIPLIEPLEYKEEHQVRDFVIVLDTSGSCSEGLVQRFLNKTYNILKQTEHFSDRAVLHVIQCDAAIQEDVRIDSLEHLEEYLERMELKGGGGTDFRPAFEYVDGLCRKNEFQKLCGLIYFTDGYGIFPTEPPDYKTAFVFVERDEHVRVPPWAIRLYLEEDDV